MLMNHDSGTLTGSDDFFLGHLHVDDAGHAHRTLTLHYLINDVLMALFFAIAGKEAGYPPTRHLDAFQLVMRENFHITIHAGEAFGLPSIWEALQWCGAERLGHGVRIVDDITVRPDGEVEILFDDPRGDTFSAATVAVLQDGRLIAGSVRDSGLLICDAR